MGFVYENSGIASSIYLALYFLFVLTAIYVVARKGFKHLYTFLLFFGSIRTASQFCGVAFSALGIEHWQWLIAYLILGAEGYFVLIYTSLRFICAAQEKKYGRSWVLHTGPKKFDNPIQNFMFGTWEKIFHHVLIPANALVIAGGAIIAGIDTTDNEQYSGKVTTSKILRTVGQSLFLFLTVLVILLNIYVYFKERIRNHTTMTIFLASPFLLVRGIFGVMSIYITNMNYFQLSNYSAGFSKHLIIYEYVLGTTMEFVSAILLISNYFIAEKYLKTV